jgi:putative phosphoesterase
MGMKLGLISDIHCNLDSLKRALELLDDCDEILCAGDLVYQYRFSNEVLAELRRRDVRAILGNHDKTVLYSSGHSLRSSPSVDPFYLEYLAGLPSNLLLTYGSTRVAMFHGSPWDQIDGPIAYYIYPKYDEQLKRLASVDADFIVLGHTHVPMAVPVDGRLVINPGSCGEPHFGKGTFTCAVLDLDTGRTEFREFSLDSTASSSVSQQVSVPLLLPKQGGEVPPDRTDRGVSGPR